MSAVRLREVSKCFWVSHEKPALVRALLPRLVRPLRYERYWALRDIDVAIAEGESLGVIGPNGSGKTTLLSVIAGITDPTSGSVSVKGKVAALLSLGSGFHPELTGLENIFLNGTILGMSTREIRRKLEAIVAFSQLDGFIDAPLQTYSTGMQLRLGFAIAIHTDFDVLLIDEVIAAGDQAFQSKCLERLRALKRAGKTLILAAQTTGMLESLADRVLLLHRGQVIADGTAEHVRWRYASLIQWLAPTEEPLSADAKAAVQREVDRHDPRSIQYRWGEQLGTGQAEVEDVRLLDSAGRSVDQMEHGAALTVALRFMVATSLPNPHIGVAIFRDDGTYCYGPNTRMDGRQFNVLPAGTYECLLHFDELDLTPGRYRLSVAIWDITEQVPHAYHKACYPLRVTGTPVPGVLLLDHAWRECQHASASVRIPQLTVEGPRGDQAWYRTFEPLTLTALLPPPQGQAVPTLLAECRGSKDELWWASRWCPPPVPARRREWLHPYQVQFPHVRLLTGRYRWSIGWEGVQGTHAPASTITHTLDIVADRLDHGLLCLPHRWEIRGCDAH